MKKLIGPVGAGGVELELELEVEGEVQAATSVSVAAATEIAASLFMAGLPVRCESLDSGKAAVAAGDSKGSSLGDLPQMGLPLRVLPADLRRHGLHS
nr:hypothetical protein [Ramlibacter tataouinensis]